MHEDGRPGGRRARPRRAVLAASLIAVVISVATANLALASFLDGAGATATLSTDTRLPPSDLTAGLCLLGSVTLNWTATPSAWSDGYEVRWGTTPGGPHTTGSATTVLPTTTVTGLSLLTTYYFVVRAYDGNWRSADTAQRTVAC